MTMPCLIKVYLASEGEKNYSLNRMHTCVVSVIIGPTYN